MAICKLCKREMKTAHGCVCHNYVHDGKAMAAIKYGSEDYDFPVSKNSVCHDCNVRPGEYHHIGCDRNSVLFAADSCFPANVSKSGCRC